MVYTYFAEFLQMDKRGEHLSWLCLFWMMGGLYASFTAWGIIPHYGSNNAILLVRFGYLYLYSKGIELYEKFIIICFDALQIPNGFLRSSEPKRAFFFLKC